MTKQEVKKYTHKRFLEDIAILGAKLEYYHQNVIPLECVIGVSRGGLIPAVYLSHILKIPMRVVEYSDRDNMVGDSSAEWLKTVSSAVIVDDIADSGRTLNYLTSINPDLITAVLIQNEFSDHIADFYGSRVIGDRWISFEWEPIDK